MRELKIGEHIWTVENLDVSTYRNGDPIPNIEDAEEWKNLKTGAWCYFENNSENKVKYGKLYNYHAIQDPRGLAPEGYRIPQHYDWLFLQKFGSRLKSKFEWNEKKELDFYIPFNAKPGGHRDSYGRFCYKNEAIGWWASSESDVKNQGNIAHWLYKNDSQLGWKPFFENDGFYVRCIKETHKSIKFHVNTNLHLQYNYISINYTGLTTFQEILNLIYKNFLIDIVNPYSYGVDWTIQIYDGERIEDLHKIGDKDDRDFEKILVGIYKNKFRLIISRSL